MEKSEVNVGDEVLIKVHTKMHGVQLFSATIMKKFMNVAVTDRGYEISYFSMRKLK